MLKKTKIFKDMKKKAKLPYIIIKYEWCIYFHILIVICNCNVFLQKLEPSMNPKLHWIFTYSSTDNLSFHTKVGSPSNTCTWDE